LVRQLLTLLVTLQVQELERAVASQRREAEAQRDNANTARGQITTSVTLLQNRCDHLAAAIVDKEAEAAQLKDRLGATREETDAANTRVVVAKKETAERDAEIAQLRAQLREASAPEQHARMMALEVQLKTTQNEVDVYVPTRSLSMAFSTVYWSTPLTCGCLCFFVQVPPLCIPRQSASEHSAGTAGVARS
jgi:chromosome segregation ATPase